MAIIDTYKFITKLEEAGLNEEQAKVIAEGINSVEENEGLAKSSEIAELRGMMKALLALNVGMALGIFGLFLNGIS